MPVSVQDLAPTLLGLFLTTVVYNSIVGYLESHLSRPHALTSWEVVGGVMIVLVFFLLGVNSVVLSGYQAFAITILYFIVGGIPMIIGSHWRAETAIV